MRILGPVIISFLWACCYGDPASCAEPKRALLTCCSVARGFPAHGDADGEYRVRLTVTTPLEFRNTPMDPVIDFAELVKQTGRCGFVDPNSVRVINESTRQAVACALTEDFAYADKGRVESVIADPAHRRHRLLFRITDRRRPLLPQEHTPAIGVGDPLRYNAGCARPISLLHSMGLCNLNGGGRLDLIYNPAGAHGGIQDGGSIYLLLGSGTNEAPKFQKPATEVVGGFSQLWYTARHYCGACRRRPVKLCKSACHRPARTSAGIDEQVSV